MRKLTNPLSDTYYSLKDLVLGYDLPYHFLSNSNIREETEEGHEGTGFWSHVVIERPYDFQPLPIIQSKHCETFVRFFIELASTNGLPYISLMRVNVNVQYPKENGLPTIPHVDHPFPHKVLLIYFTSAGGDIVSKDAGKSHTPMEDDIILLEGTHFNYPPLRDRRVAAVMTYI